MNKFNYVTENEFPFHSVQDWEMEVRRNLKLEADKDLYSVLAKHNSLGIKSKGFYTALDIQNISPIGEEIFHSVGLNYVFDPTLNRRIWYFQDRILRGFLFVPYVNHSRLQLL